MESALNHAQTQCITFVNLSKGYLAPWEIHCL